MLVIVFFFEPPGSDDQDVSEQKKLLADRFWSLHFNPTFEYLVSIDFDSPLVVGITEAQFSRTVVQSFKRNQ